MCDMSQCNVKMVQVGIRADGLHTAFYLWMQWSFPWVKTCTSKYEAQWTKFYAELTNTSDFFLGISTFLNEWNFRWYSDIR